MAKLQTTNDYYLVVLKAQKNVFTRNNIVFPRIICFNEA